MKRILIATALFASLAAASAQQSQPQPPKTLAEANLVIAQDRQQMAEMQLRISELEAAFTSQLTAQRQRLASQVEAAQGEVVKEQQAATPQTAKH